MINRKYNLVKLAYILNLKDYTELKKYKRLYRDLKYFYFSKRYAIDDYELLDTDEYNDYVKSFFELLKELKKIREEFNHDIE